MVVDLRWFLPALCWILPHPWRWKFTVGVGNIATCRRCWLTLTNEQFMRRPATNVYCFWLGAGKRGWGPEVHWGYVDLYGNKENIAGFRFWVFKVVLYYRRYIGATPTIDAKKAATFTNQPKGEK